MSSAADGLIWGDLNCSAGPNPVDALGVFRHDAGQPVNMNDCPGLGELVNVQPASGVTRSWGDIDCSGGIDPVDGLKLLRFDAGLSVTKIDPTCPDIGEETMPPGSPTPTSSSTPTATPATTSTATPTPISTHTASPTSTFTSAPTATATRSPTPTATLSPPSNDCDDLPQPIDIPDDSNTDPAVLFTEFDDGRTITDLDICLNIDHTYVGDLYVTLEHEGTGTTAILLNVDPSCDQNNIRVLLDDKASVLADNVCNTSGPAINGTYRPTDSLSRFDGESLNGKWIVRVYDLAAPDVGEVLGAFLYAQVVE